MNNKHFNEKDYKDVIGCKYGELMILSYTSPLKNYGSMRLCKCRCSCGKVVVLRLSHVIGGEIKSCGHLRVENGKLHKANLNQEKAYETRTSKDVPLSTNKTTGIRNISWSGREQCYVISMKRHGKYFRTRAKTLKEAINEKERMIAEIEEYFQEKIYKKG